MEVPAKYNTSRISFFYNYLFALLLIIFLILIQFIEISDSFKSIALLVCIPLIAIVLAEPEVVRSYRHYLLEEDSVTMIEGFLSKKKISIPYDQIASTTLQKNLLGRMLKFGSVKISGFKDEIVLEGIRNPDKIYKYFQGIIKSKVR